MADLIDRLSGESEPDRPKIRVHQFIARFRLYVGGQITKPQASQDLDLQGDELTQATQIVNNVDAAVGATAKTAYVLRVESIAMLLEIRNDTLLHDDGIVDKVTTKAMLGIT